MKKVSGGVCPYVVNMVGCCTHQEPIALVLEYAANGDLLRYLRAMRKLVCAKTILQRIRMDCICACRGTSLHFALCIFSVMSQNR